jgi:TolA-binding protein
VLFHHAQRPGGLPDRSRLLATALVLGLLGTTAAGQERTQPQQRKLPEALNFANGLFRDGKFGLAAEEYERFLKNGAKPGPDADDAMYGLAYAELLQLKYKEARGHFEAFLKAAPDHPKAPTARFRIGETDYLLGNLAAARAELEEFTTRYPDHKHLDTALPCLGDIYLRLGEPSKARAAYEKAIELFPDQPMDRAKLGLAQALGASKEPEKARAILAALIARAPRDQADKARYQLGLVEAGAGKYEAAVAAFEAVERANPRGAMVPEARLGRAEALDKLGHAAEAEAIWRPLIAEGPRNLGARAAFALGTSLLRRNRPAEARAALDDARRRFAGTAMAPALLFRSAEAASREGKLDDARARFVKLVDDFPKDPWAVDALLQGAELARRARDFDAARTLASSFATRFPNHPQQADARLIEARAALDAGKPREAIDLLDLLLNRDKPGPAVAHYARYYLGLAYRADGQKVKADELLDDLAKSPAAAPVANDARFLLGQGHVHAGRFAEAIEPLSKYLDAKPDGDVAPNAMAYLAVAHAELDHADESDAALKTLADRFPKSEALTQARLRLAEKAMAAEHYDRAAGLFRPVAEGDDAKTRNRALSGLGWALLKGKKPAEAAEAFGKLLADAPDDPLAPEAALARGRALEEAERPEDALAAYAQAAETYAKSDQGPAAAIARARLLAKVGKAAEAAEAFEAYLNDHPKGEPDHLDDLLADWGWALLDADKVADADRVFGRLLKEFADSPRAAEARVNLAESAYQARKYDEVDKLLAPLLAADTKAAPRLVQSALYRHAWTRFRRDDWAGAARSLDRLLKDHPDNPFAREAKYLRAEVDFQAGHAKAAEAAFAAIAAETPAADENGAGWARTARLRRVQCLVQLERWADALTLADPLKAEIPADDPQRAELDYARGRALQGTAKFDDARAAYQAVIEARKGGDLAARAQLMRGETYFHQKDDKAALREFLQVALLYDAPRWQAAAMLEAGKVYERLDQWAEAADIYKKLGSKFPNDPAAAEAARRLSAARKHLGGDPGEG